MAKENAKQPYSGVTWESGAIITRNKLQNIDDAVSNFSNEVAEARTRSNESSNSGSLKERLDNMIIGSTKKTDITDETMLWVDTNVENYTIPVQDDFDNLVLMQNTQPDTSTYPQRANKIWIKNSEEQIEIPTIDELEQLQDTIANNYSTSKTYNTGDYVYYNDQLYKCVNDITVAGAWNASCWNEAVLADDVSELNNDLKYNRVNLLRIINTNTVHCVSPNGITFDWKNSYMSINGTATQNLVYNFCRRFSNHDIIIPNKKLYITLDHTLENMHFDILCWKNNDLCLNMQFFSSGEIIIPDYDEITLRLFVAEGTTVNTTVLIVATQQLNIDDLEDKIAAINNFLDINYLNFLKDYSIEKNGLTFVKNKENISISGIATNSTTTYFDLFFNKKSFPYNFSAKDTIYIQGNSEIWNLRIYYYYSVEESSILLYNKRGSNLNDEITIPENAIGCIIRLQKATEAGIDYSSIINLKILKTAPKDNQINKNISLLAIGNSFLNGAVYKNNQYHHMVGYEDSIYGQIGIALNVPSFNVHNYLYSSTGLMTDGGKGTLLNIIKNTDLISYDYLVTQISSTDLSSNNLGTISASDNDGTIAGAVINLCNYIKNNNTLCQLILLGTPPVSAAPSRSGQNAFIGDYGNGASINDLDILMNGLAKIYHFIYISWQELELSYHYLDYADYTTGQTNFRHAKDDRVYRIFGEYAGRQLYKLKENARYNNFYNNTYNITTTPTITTDVNGWLQPVDTILESNETNKTDMTPAIMSMLNDTGYCHLAPGVYYVSGNIDMPEGGSLIGCGDKTVIKLLNSVTSGYCVKINQRNIVKDISFIGDLSSNYPTLNDETPRHAIYFFSDQSTSANLPRPDCCIITNCHFRRFMGSGIYGYDTGATLCTSLLVSNCYFNKCFTAINLSYRVEYCKFTNIITYRCYYGCINNGGNNTFINCTFHGTIGFMIDNENNQSGNSGHGTVMGCVFNHIDNQSNPSLLGSGDAIICKNTPNGFVFTGCQIWYGDIRIYNSKGISISNSQIGNSKTAPEIEITGTYPVFFSNCIFSQTPTITAPSNSHFDNCYLATDGSSISI